MIRTFEYVRCGLINRGGSSPGGGVRLLAGVQAQGIEAEGLHFVHFLPIVGVQLRGDGRKLWQFPGTNLERYA